MQTKPVLQPVLDVQPITDIASWSKQTLAPGQGNVHDIVHVSFNE